MKIPAGQPITRRLTGGRLSGRVPKGVLARAIASMPAAKFGSRSANLKNSKHKQILDRFHFAVAYCCDYATETKVIKKDPLFTGQRIYFAPPILKISGGLVLERLTWRWRPRITPSAPILSLRTFTRRFVRCTINFSKKTENHRHAVAIFVATFNFCRVHKSLAGKTPATAAGLTDHVWTIGELLSATN